MHSDRVDARPATDHVQGLIDHRPGLPVAVIARKAGIAPSTLKSLLSDAQRGPDAARTVSHATAARLLAVKPDDLPHRDRGYGGRSTDAAPALRHVRELLTSHPHLSQATLARAAEISLTTLAAALHDVDAGRPRRIQKAAADRLLALGNHTPLPEHATRRSDTVDAQHVVNHVRTLQLRYDRASTAFIAQTAQVNPSTLASALIDHERDARRGINKNVARRVLAVHELPPPAFLRRTHVTETGLLRRLRGMCAVGWTLPTIAQAGATTAKSLTDFAKSGTSTPAVRGAVLTAWARFAHQPGPSAHARRHAAAKSWDPPLAWDEHSIDNPDTTPNGTRIPGTPQRWDPSLLRHELAFFTRHGLSRPECLRRLGLSTGRARQLLTKPPAPDTHHTTAA
ncbi:hypothetical protein [Streptomyces sp. NBC_00233]|uniref:hypothetical protein n=1 Tax=Streptomyces sp. NBC_00233 TaxID=2975686 RepID=UPI0022598AB7|nr:hypothetical protein [Streptomyces sp. NBC_00233]MCX5233243.1 hypothetical protein [Streptomyces sp. NBC_00233]